jgi:hypothetical protein
LSVDAHRERSPRNAHDLVDKLQDPGQRNLRGMGVVVQMISQLLLKLQRAGK